MTELRDRVAVGGSLKDIECFEVIMGLQKVEEGRHLGLIRQDRPIRLTSRY